MIPLRPLIRAQEHYTGAFLNEEMTKVEIFEHKGWWLWKKTRRAEAEFREVKVLPYQYKETRWVYPNETTMSYTLSDWLKQEAQFIEECRRIDAVWRPVGRKAKLPKAKAKFRSE